MDRLPRRHTRIACLYPLATILSTLLILVFENPDSLEAKVAAVLDTTWASPAPPASCDPTCPPGMDDPPAIVFFPDNQTVYSATLDVMIDWCDDTSLDPDSRSIFLIGTGKITGQFDYQAGVGFVDCGYQDKARSEGTITLNVGANTLQASICDSAGQCTTEQTVYTYDPTAPVLVWTTPHNGDYQDASRCVLDCFEAVTTYTTPAYFSMDQAHSVTLLHRSRQANPRGLVQVDAAVPGDSTPDTFSMKLKRPDATWVTFTNGSQEMFWDGTTDTVRLAVQFDARTLATGAHNYTAVVRAHYGGAFEEATRQVRVLIVNEDDSDFGWGWSLVGFQRLHFHSDSIAITEGDGSIAFFRHQFGDFYRTPDGDFTTLVKQSDGTYDRTYPDGTTLHFLGDGRLDEVEDRLGNTTSYGYYANLRLKEITDPAGKKITLTYGGDGLLDYIDDPGSRRTTVIHDSQGNKDVVTIKDPGNKNALQVTYYGQHLVNKRTDRGGTVSRVKHDHAKTLKLDSLISTITVGEQSVRPFVVFSSYEVQMLVDLNSGEGTSSNPATAKKPSELTPWVKDPNGNQTKFTLNRFMSALKIEEPLGRTTQFKHNTDGQVTESTSPQGLVLKYTWSGPNLLRYENTSSGQIVDWTYESTYNEMTSQSGDAPDIDAYWSAGTLDSLEENALVTSFTYDSIGRLTQSTDARGHDTDVFYHSSGFQNTDSIKAGPRKQSFVYDSHGRQTKSINPQGDTTKVVYTAINRVTKTIGVLSDTTTFTYGDMFLTGVTDAVGNSYSFTLNKLGWVEDAEDPNSKSDLYEYDLNGNVTKWTNRRGQAVTASYDSLNFQTELVANGDTTTFEYDPDGSFVAAENANSLDSLKFNVSGRLTRQVTVRGATTYELKSTFNKRGLRTKLEMLSPWSRTIQFAYNNATNQLKTLTDLDGNTTSLSYNADLQLDSLLLPGNQAITFNIPSTHSRSKTEYSSVSLDSVFGVENQLDTLGRVKYNADRRMRAYVYDKASRLEATAPIDSLSGGCTSDPDFGSICVVDLGPVTAWQYDKVGNRGDTIGTGNRVTSFDGYTIEYDDDGNVTRKHKAGFDQRFYWNAIGQLDSVTTDGTATRFLYDGFGRRIKKWSSSETSQYVYDRDQAFMELTSGGAIRIEYANYSGLDNPHSMRRGGNTYYYALDPANGSVLGLFNSSGTVKNEYWYEVFGEEQSSSEAIGNRIRFAAREHDSESELYFMRARYYDPHMGRFLSEDPLGLAAGINPYVYVGNNPISRRDPSGLGGPCWFAGIWWPVCPIDPIELDPIEVEGIPSADTPLPDPNELDRQFGGSRTPCEANPLLCFGAETAKENADELVGVGLSLGFLAVRPNKCAKSPKRGASKGGLLKRLRGKSRLLAGASLAGRIISVPVAIFLALSAPADLGVGSDIVHPPRQAVPSAPRGPIRPPNTTDVRPVAVAPGSLAVNTKCK